MTTRTHTCGELRTANIGTSVTLTGWVASARNLGGILFLDLRDRYGITQAVVDPANKSAYEIAERFRTEFVVAITGSVRKREKINSGLPTGEIEVFVEHVELLNAAETTPFTITDEVTANEDLRLKYRYLDLRRPSLQKNLLLRHTISQTIRKYFDERGFIEVETPVMMKATPEGARDYLVPSRIHQGKFYALPQSPQTYKQILMVAGLDKYFQIVKCFRDEDLRADRQPEFTQIDVEISFPTEETIYDVMETMLHRVWEVCGYTLPKPFPRFTYHDAMRRFGSDKPDLRYDVEITTLSDTLRGKTEFKVFEEPLAQKDGVVAALVVSGGAAWTRSQLDSFGDVAKTYGAGGVVWIKLNDTGFDSSAKKFLNDDVVQAIANASKAKKGDLVAIIAHATSEKAYTILGALRSETAKRLGLLEGKAFQFAPAWILDFPMFETDESSGTFFPKHHPFTSPNIDDWKRRNENPALVRARAYDVVMNGYELGSGSIRIHDRALQEEVFDMLAISREEQEKKFGFLLNAFRYGAPPHGGMALGVDRIAMLLAGTNNIRDVIAFPKTTSAASLMDDAPSEVDPKQLKELHIRIE